MVEKAVEPEHFVYIVLSREEPEREYGYRKDFDYLEEAKKFSKSISSPTKIVRARKATVLRFMKRSKGK